MTLRLPPVIRVTRRVASALLAFGVVAVPAAARAQGAASPVAPPVANTPAAVVRSITRTALPRGERITIELSQEVPYSGDRIPDPDRVYFDLRNAAVPAAVAERARALEGTLVKSLRVGRHDDHTTRVVLELAGAPRHSVFTTYEPFRLVIDLEGVAPPVAKPAASDAHSASTQDPPTRSTSPAASSVSVTPFAAPSTQTDAGSAPQAPHADADRPSATRPVATDDVPSTPTSTSRGNYSLARQLGLGISRVVIDPGHGGHDPGAQSNGVDEAELVLDVALRLEKLLQEQPGVDVVLTRRTDEFIPLDERTAIANREGADLFLSIHANASREPTARGIETYFLNFASNPSAEAVAARENAASNGTMGNLPELVKTIALNNKLAESREMATVVQASLVRRLKVQNKTLRDLGVKQAPFVVLIGAQMPSVLAEISFLTNHGEAALLKLPAYRQRIAQALCDAVVSYRSSLKKATTMAAKDGRK